jgi:hypothetical protein
MGELLEATRYENAKTLQVAMVFCVAEIVTGCRFGFAMPTTPETPVAGLMKV